MQVFGLFYNLFADLWLISVNFYTFLLLYPIRQDLLLTLFQAIKFKKLNKKKLVFIIYFELYNSISKR